MKVIAFYLPQYHEIDENNAWWGKGFTEWTNLKKAKPLFDGHYQPRIPLNNNYYNLLDNSVQEWQCKIARENGIYGFCFYHYWFDGHMLLQKPVEQYLANTNCDLPFCICWANENWTKAWESKKNTVLIEQKYGDEKQWEKHFNYLLPYFNDERYIKVDGKPLFVIYRPEIIECKNEMIDYWQKLAKKHGFPGIKFAYQHISYDDRGGREDKRFDYAIEYQPGYGLRDMDHKSLRALKRLKSNINLILEKNFNKTIDTKQLLYGKKHFDFRDYDKVWDQILKRIPPNNKYIPGAFTDWDNSPRRGDKGTIFLGATPEKFEKYFEKLIYRAKEIYNKDMIFIFAWNEWTEGGYLEPDEKFGYGYLNAIRDALKKTGEFPW